MKKYFCLVFILFIITFLLLRTVNVKAFLPLSGKIIVIDPGHGGKDPGTSYNGILEKDINLKISLALEKQLSRLGASVILTRDGDYDLSTANAFWRKKSDFDNRIKLINNSNANLYISIHLNYLEDSRYYGPQVFYNKSNKTLAEYLQNELNYKFNGKRKVKNIPSRTYMYSKLNPQGILIECGFLSNYSDRNNLIKTDYQEQLAISIANAIARSNLI